MGNGSRNFGSRWIAGSALTRESEAESASGGDKRGTRRPSELPPDRFVREIKDRSTVLSAAGNGRSDPLAPRSSRDPSGALSDSPVNHNKPYCLLHEFIGKLDAGRGNEPEVGYRRVSRGPTSAAFLISRGRAA